MDDLIRTHAIRGTAPGEFGLMNKHVGAYMTRIDDLIASLLGTGETALETDAWVTADGIVVLDHDGVPWNNNVAENAVKLIASRRKLLGTAFTEDGIKEYLIFLSIYQTLRYRNASLWEFLLSGETNIETFFGNKP